MEGTTVMLCSTVLDDGNSSRCKFPLDNMEVGGLFRTLYTGFRIGGNL